MGKYIKAAPLWAAIYSSLSLPKNSHDISQASTARVLISDGPDTVLYSR